MFITIVLYVLLILTLIVTIYWYYIYFFIFLYRLPNFKYVKPWPFIGNALELLPLSDIISHILNFRRMLGKTFKGIMGYEIILITCDDKFIENICTSKNWLTKSDHYDALSLWLNDGLLLSTGNKWMKRRKLLTPSFHFNTLENFISIFNQCGDILIKKLKDEIDKDSVDLYPYITLCTLDVIYESTMGVKVHAQEEENSIYIKAVKEQTRISFEKMYNLFKSYPFLYKFTFDYQREKKTLKILHDTTDDIIHARRKLLIETDCNEKKYFLDILLQSTIDGQPLSNLDIREEVDTFLFEGHDTTSSALVFTLYELSINPHVQVKLLNEVESIVGKGKNSPITLNDLQEMKYLDMVIKEVLRKYPSVPIISRKYDKDYAYDGEIIPKGTTILIVPYTLHRNTDTFPDPEKFDPERFSVENRLKIGPYAYIPFSAGFRNCIGQKFAMLELKAIISHVLRNFELLPVENYRPKLILNLILKSSNGILVKLKKRY